MDVGYAVCGNKYGVQGMGCAVWGMLLQFQRCMWPELQARASTLVFVNCKTWAWYGVYVAIRLMENCNVKSGPL